MVQKTYTPLGLDMGTWGLGDMTRMKVPEDASSVRRCNLDMNERIVSSIMHQISSTQVHHVLNVSPEKPGEACPTRIVCICYTCYIGGFLVYCKD